MTLLQWIMLGAGIYLVLGILMLLMLIQTPYADNPWWLMVLLWPLFLYGMLWG